MTSESGSRLSRSVRESRSEQFASEPKFRGRDKREVARFAGTIDRSKIGDVGENARASARRPLAWI